MTSCVVLAANFILTFSLLRQCKNAELTVGKDIPDSEKREATEKNIDYYARTIFRYQVTACIVSIVTGLLMDKIY